MIACLDTLLIALYVELTDRIIPARPVRRGPGRPPAVTDAEMVCLAVAQVLLRHDDERRWLRAAPRLVGHLFPRLLSQPEYNRRLRRSADLMAAALRWIGQQTPGTAELLRLMDATPLPCGASRVTARRSDLFGYAGYGYEVSHSRYYWGTKLTLVVTADGTVTGFGLANPKLVGERQAVLEMFTHPDNLPAPGTVIVADKGYAGTDFEQHLARSGQMLVRPAHRDHGRTVHAPPLGRFPLSSLPGEDLDEHLVLLRWRKPLARLAIGLRLRHFLPPER